MSSVIVSKDLTRLLSHTSSLSKHGIELTDNDILKYGIKDPEDVPELSALNIAVVLEDLADQLDVLGRSIGGPEIELRSKPSIEFARDHHRPKPVHADEGDGEGPKVEKYLLKQHYMTVIPRRVQQSVDGPHTTYTRRLSQAIRGSYLNTLTENGKLMVDRAFLQKVIQDVMIDIIQRSSLESLVNCIEGEKENKKEMYRMAYSGIEHEIQKKTLKGQIKSAKKEKVLELQRYERLIWSLEDANQELLTRTGMEHSFMTKTGKMISKRSIKQCKKIEEKFQTKVSNAQLDLRHEHHSHESMMHALGNQMDELKVKLEYWMDKYDTDKDQLQGELDTMKSDREKDLKRIAWLIHMINNYNQVVTDERRIRAIAESRRERTELEIKKAIKLQAWWRGEMVRKKLGPYKVIKPKKPVKDKKSKKDKKKK